MAEAAAAAAAATTAAGIPVPGEEPVLEIKPGDVISDSRTADIEAAAREKGWKPESEYDGPRGGFVGAEEFLKREPLFEKIKAQSKELKGLKKTVEAMTSQFQTQVRAQVELRLRELKAAKKEAIEAGDVAQVEQIDAEMEQQKKAVAPAVEEVPDEVSEWMARNKWFQTDAELNAFAVAHNRTYIAKHPGDVAGSLEATEKAVRKAFPEKFETPKPKAAPSPVEGALAPKGGDDKKYSTARLTPQQKLVYDQIVKRDKVLSHDDYFKGLEEIGELS